METPLFVFWDDEYYIVSIMNSRVYILFFIADQVNRDPMSNEMLKMRQQLEYLQAELFARGGSSSDEIQVHDYETLYNSTFHLQHCVICETL